MIKSFPIYKSIILEDNRSHRLNFKSDGRYYYVYRITHKHKDIHYYGSRVTKLDPQNDLGKKYFSSSSDKKFITEQKISNKCFKYKIIKVFDNPADSLIFESYLHQYFHVSSHIKFINKVNQTPFGMTNNGSTSIATKISNSLLMINPDSGMSIAKTAGIKSSITKTKIDPNTGQSIAQQAGLKISKSRKMINPDSGMSIAKTAGIKSSITKTKIDPNTGQSIATISSKKSVITKTKIDPITGLSLQRLAILKMLETKSKINNVTGLSTFQEIGLKGTQTRIKIDPNTGQSIAQQAGLKISKTKHVINKSTGNTVCKDAALKGANTRTKIDPSTGLSIAQQAGLKISGVNSHKFKGYFMYLGIKYITASQLSEHIGVSNSTIRLWCQSKNLEYISIGSYYRSTFLKNLGPIDIITSNTFKSLGFGFQTVEKLRND